MSDGYLEAPMMNPEPQLWFRQFRAMLRIELRKTLYSKRAIASYVLASMPVIIMLIAALDTDSQGRRTFQSIEEAREVFGMIYTTLILGGVVFLGVASIFTTLLRGEILDRSIHYYVLTPVRRDIFILSKFAAGLGTAMLLFGGGTLICFLFLYLPFGTQQLVSDLTNGIALQQMGQYLGITLLACMGYGSLFMAASLLFRNPLIPLVVIVTWETIHFILPPTLKLFSVIHYLKGLLPIPLDEGPLAVIVAPPPVWVSIVGMFGLCFVTVSGAVFLMKRLEVKYSDE